MLLGGACVGASRYAPAGDESRGLFVVCGVVEVLGGGDASGGND